MTDRTREHYEKTCLMLAQVNLGIQFGSFTAAALMQQTAGHLLLMHCIRDLSAVLLEEIGDEVVWCDGASL